MIRNRPLQTVAMILCDIVLANCSRPSAPSVLPDVAPSDASTLGQTQFLDSSFGRQMRLDATFKLLFSFNVTDGAQPQADLIDVNGTLYGTTSEGGAYGYGTVYKTTTSGKEKVLHSFNGTDGADSQAGLTDVNGTLYGTTELGGSGCGGYGCGTVFRITTSGKETVLYRFKGGTDGEFPYAQLIEVGGVLYGTTRAGGSKFFCGSGNGCGTVFKLTESGVETVLHHFKGGNDGKLPYAGLTDVDGAFYGTTEFGGRRCYPDGCGTVFKITGSGAERVIYSFKGGSDGKYPATRLRNIHGTLYGTTRYGGIGGSNCGKVRSCGTVFQITTSGSETVLYRFKAGADGGQPQADLTAMNGALYGTTSGGGADNDGVIFKIAKSGTETVLHSFNGTDGAEPAAGLARVGGTLYGTTTQGASGWGTLFSESP